MGKRKLLLMISALVLGACASRGASECGGDADSVPQMARLHFERGRAKYEKGDYADAIADYDTAIDVCPGYAESYYARALAKAKLGNYDGTAEDFATGIELDPSANNR